MTSMRIDGDKSAKVWAKRLQGLLDAMKADGVVGMVLEAEGDKVSDLVALYKDGNTTSATLRNEEA